MKKLLLYKMYICFQHHRLTIGYLRSLHLSGVGIFLYKVLGKSNRSFKPKKALQLIIGHNYS